MTVSGKIITKENTRLVNSFSRQVYTNATDDLDGWFTNGSVLIDSSVSFSIMQKRETGLQLPAGFHNTTFLSTTEQNRICQLIRKTPLNVC
jgi:hypothetical protein